MMRNSVLPLILCALLLAACTAGGKKPAASPKEVLSERLAAYAAEGKVLYGHQDDLSYGHAWCVTDWENDGLTRSDVRDVTGKYPAVVGFDLGGIELGDSCNLDKVPFGLMRKAALAHIGRGGIVTFSWHPRNPLTGGDAWDISSDEVVYSILMMKNGFIAPNINFENPDEDSCHLWIPATRLERKFDTFLSNSFGFGGTNSTLIIRNA